MNHREMKALAENADAVRSLATYLLKLPAIDAQITWTDWELDFLEHMARHQGAEPLSLRQVEVLAELKDGARSYATIDRISVGNLIDACALGCRDLSEDDETFVVALKASGVRTLRRRQLLKLLACARQLGHVERYVDLAA